MPNPLLGKCQSFKREKGSAWCLEKLQKAVTVISKVSTEQLAPKRRCSAAGDCILLEDSSSISRGCLKSQELPLQTAPSRPENLVGMMMLAARRRWGAAQPRPGAAMPPPFTIPLALLAILPRLRRFKRQICIVSQMPAFLLGMLNMTILFPLPSNGLGFSSNANSDMRTFPKCTDAIASALQALTSGSQPLHPMACKSAPETRSCPNSSFNTPSDGLLRE